MTTRNAGRRDVRPMRADAAVTPRDENPMKTVSLSAILATLLVATAMAQPDHGPAGGAADGSGSAAAQRDYALYVDTPTGSAYIRLPSGWTFVGHLDPDRVARLSQHDDKRPALLGANDRR